MITLEQYGHFPGENSLDLILFHLGILEDATVILDLLFSYAVLWK